MRWGFSRYIDPGSGEPIRGLWISAEGPNSLSHRRFIWIFSSFFQLFLVYLEKTALYTVYVIWTFCCTGNKAFMNVSKWFYCEISFSVSMGPQNSLVPPCKFLLETQSISPFPPILSLQDWKKMRFDLKRKHKPSPLIVPDGILPLNLISAFLLIIFTVFHWFK
jgi:hypothetical protein